MDKKRYSCKSMALFALCTLLSLTSCIKEDLSECPVQRIPIRVQLSHDIQDDEEDVRAIFSRSETPEKATLYVFDDSGRFVNSTSRYDVVMGEEYELEIDIDPGIYHFVVWIGEGTPYYTKPGLGAEAAGTVLKKDATLNLEVPSGRVVDSELPRLRYARLDEETVVGGGQLLHFDLVQNTNTIILTASGLDKTDDSYSFNIADDNGSYDFDNNHAPFGAFNYKARASFEGDSEILSTRMTVLRMGEGRSPLFTFKNETTGEELYPSYEGQEKNLVALIKKAYEGRTIDFDRRHVFRVNINFQTGADATISVDGWNVNESGNELYPD